MVMEHVMVPISTARMGDSEQMRALVAALTPKVQQCRDESRLGGHVVDHAFSQLSHFGDSDELRDLFWVFLEDIRSPRS